MLQEAVLTELYKSFKAMVVDGANSADNAVNTVGSSSTAPKAEPSVPSLKRVSLPFFLGMIFLGNSYSY